MRVFAGLLMLLALGVPLQAGPLEKAQMEALYDQALGAFEAGKLETSLDLLKQAQGLFPEDVQVNLLDGLALCSLGRFEEAKVPLKKVLKKDPVNRDAGTNLGIAYFETGRWKAAKKTFEKVLEYAPDQTEAHVDLGILALRSENWGEARIHFEKAVSLDKKNRRAWIGLSDAQAWLNLNVDAAKSRRKALSLKPGDTEVRLKLAGSLYSLGEIDEVLQTLRGMEKSTQPEAQFLFGVSYYRQGRFDKSEKAFKRALELQADYPAARINLGITYYDQGNFEKAVRQFKEVLKEHPKHDEARENLSVAREVATALLTKKGTQAYVAGSFQQALQLWRRALDLRPKNKVVQGLVETAQERLEGQAEKKAREGSLAFEQEKLSVAVRAWNDALDMDPQNKEARQGLNKASKNPSALAAIYEKEIAAQLLEGAFPRARRMADEVNAVSHSVGKRLLKKIKIIEEKKAARLTEQGDNAAHEKKWKLASEAYEHALALRVEDKALRRKLNQSHVALRQAVSSLLRQATASHDPQEAYHFYQQALRMDPDNGRAQDGARSSARKAKLARVDPKKVNAVYFKGVYAYAKGDTQGAIDLWEKALKMDPKHHQALQAVEEAKRKLKAITELDKKP